MVSEMFDELRHGGVRRAFRGARDIDEPEGARIPVERLEPMNPQGSCAIPMTYAFTRVSA
jgi:hypothetical protein